MPRHQSYGLFTLRKDQRQKDPVSPARIRTQAPAVGSEHPIHYTTQLALKVPTVNAEVNGLVKNSLKKERRATPERLRGTTSPRNT